MNKDIISLIIFHLPNLHTAYELWRSHKFLYNSCILKYKMLEYRRLTALHKFTNAVMNELPCAVFAGQTIWVETHLIHTISNGLCIKNDHVQIFLSVINGKLLFIDYTHNIVTYTEVKHIKKILGVWYFVDDTSKKRTYKRELKT